MGINSLEKLLLFFVYQLSELVHCLRDFEGCFHCVKVDKVKGFFCFSCFSSDRVFFLCQLVGDLRSY